MATPELTPPNEFDANYWYPMANASAAFSKLEPQAAARRHRRDNAEMKKMAEVLEARLTNPKAPSWEVLYGLALDLSEIPAETFVRFCRERLTVATHPNLAIANAAAEEHKLSQGGLAGVRYSPKPDHQYYPEEGLHVVFRYEEQEGMGVVLFNEHGKPGVFGIRPVKKRVNVGTLQRHGVGFSNAENIQESIQYEFEDLRLPTNKPAIVGFNSQSTTKTGKDLHEVEVCRLERIKYFQVF